MILKSLGIDVGVRKKLDLVLLDSSRAVLFCESRVPTEELPSICRRLRPDLVAIDSPPAWGMEGSSRLAERELRRFNIMSYATPSDSRKQKSSFYGWMRVGFAAFQVLARQFPRYRSGRFKGTAIEVFPHASEVLIAGKLRPPTMKKHEWRRLLLRRESIEVDVLSSKDQVDAALAALTGIYALSRCSISLGSPNEGIIVLPRTHQGCAYMASCQRAAEKRRH